MGGGKILQKNPPQVVIECGGLGYEIDVPMSTFYNLPNIGEEVFLDDVTLTELKNALQVQVDIVKSSGQDLIKALLD